MAVAAGLCFLTVIKIKPFFEPKKIIYLRKKKTCSGVTKKAICTLHFSSSAMILGS